MKSLKKGIYINNKILYKIFILKNNNNIYVNNLNIYIIYNIFKNYNIYCYNGKYIYKFNKNIFNNLYKKIKLYNLII